MMLLLLLWQILFFSSPVLDVAIVDSVVGFGLVRLLGLGCGGTGKTDRDFFTIPVKNNTLLLLRTHVVCSLLG